MGTGGGKIGRATPKTFFILFFFWGGGRNYNRINSIIVHEIVNCLAELLIEEGFDQIIPLSVPTMYDVWA